MKMNFNIPKKQFEEGLNNETTFQSREYKFIKNIDDKNFELLFKSKKLFKIKLKGNFELDGDMHKILVRFDYPLILKIGYLFVILFLVYFYTHANIFIDNNITLIMFILLITSGIYYKLHHSKKELIYILLNCVCNCNLSKKEIDEIMFRKYKKLKKYIIIIDMVLMIFCVFQSGKAFFSEQRKAYTFLNTQWAVSNTHDICVSKEHIYLYNPTLGIMEYDFDGNFLGCINIFNSKSFNEFFLNEEEDKLYLAVENTLGLEEGQYAEMILYEVDFENKVLNILNDDYVSESEYNKYIFPLDINTVHFISRFFYLDYPYTEYDNNIYILGLNKIYVKGENESIINLKSNILSLDSEQYSRIEGIALFLLVYLLILDRNVKFMSRKRKS